MLQTYTKRDGTMNFSWYGPKHEKKNKKIKKNIDHLSFVANFIIFMIENAHSIIAIEFRKINTSTTTINKLVGYWFLSSYLPIT